jgi:recombination DNA repair RAD52 pathway protein
MPVECSTFHALFSRRDAIMRHKRLKHGENDEEDEDVDMNDSPAHSDAENNQKKDNVVFSQMAQKAHEHTADEWQKKYDKYKKQNMPEKKANSKANEKTRGETYQLFRKLYEHFL